MKETIEQPEPVNREAAPAPVDYTDLVDHAPKVAWEAYKKAVGGKTYNGDPMPEWSALCDDATKATIVQAWRDAAAAVWKLSKLDETHQIIKTGHAGILLGSGMIVDMRLHPDAIKIPE